MPTTTCKAPAPVARKVSQMLLLDGQYYWAHPEVAATLAAFFDPDGGELIEGYTEDDFRAYVDKNLSDNRLQRYC